MEEKEKSSQDLETRDPDAASSADAAGRSRKKRAGHRAALIGAVVLVLLAAAYVGVAQHWKNRFFPNTYINGMNVSGLTPEETGNLFNTAVADYSLTIHAREADDAVITGDQAGLRYEFSDTFQTLVDQQNIYSWPLRYARQTNYEIDTIVSVDDQKFQAAADTLPFLDLRNFRTPSDAYLAEDTEGAGYRIVPEEEGTSLDRDAAISAIRTAMCSLLPELDLETAGVYEEPKIRSDDPVLTASLASLEQYTKTVIIYDSGSNMVIDGKTIRNWITLNADGTVTLDRDKISAFTSVLAKQYDTYGKPKPFHTSWGKDITINTGTYGWKVDQKAEADWIAATVPTGQQVTRTPEFSHKAAVYGEADYGDTYVEVNITAQHLYYYKNGKVVVSSDFVSGNVSRGTGTDLGIYPIAYKQRNATLRGETYTSHVNYWMPFNNGEGLHDALWRSEFGGNIYLTSGSHGCVNLPYDAAKTIYENISAGTPVIVYELSGTESEAVIAAQQAAESAAASAAAESASAASAAAESASQASRESETATQEIGPGINMGGTDSTSSGSSSSGTVQPVNGTSAEETVTAADSSSETAAAETAAPAETSATVTPSTDSVSGPGATLSPAETSSAESTAEVGPGV